MYLFSHYIKEKNMNTSSGFIHIPETLEQSVLEKALKIMIKEITSH
jgi:pyrrolidone-carboxylate peptidase